MYLIALFKGINLCFFLTSSGRLSTISFWYSSKTFFLISNTFSSLMPLILNTGLMSLENSSKWISLATKLLLFSLNLPVILIQDNNVICEDVLTSLNEVNKKDNKKIFHDYNIKIKREIFPRFRIESYVKKLVLKQSDGNYVIDLYCSKYPRQFSEKKDKPFLSELNRIKSGIIRNSDILDFKELSFVSNNAWGVDDWFRFSFVDFELYDIIEYDGNYIIRLGCQSSIFMENLLDKIYSDSAENKYKTKQAKKNIIYDFSSCAQNENYTVQDNIDLDSLENITFSIENNITK